MNIMKLELSRNKKTFFVWSFVIAGMTAMFMLMFPAMKEQLNGISTLNGDLSVAFGMEKLDVGTPIGYYGAMAMMISLGGAMFASILASSALSKEEQGHTAEFLLTHPVTRFKIVYEKLLSIVLQIIIFDFICVIFSIGSFLILNEKFPIYIFALFLISQILLHCEIAAACFLVSAFQNNVNIGVGMSIAILPYFLNCLINIRSDLGALKYFTPYRYSAFTNLYANNQIDWKLVFIGLLIMILCVIISFIKYNKKDIRV